LPNVSFDGFLSALPEHKQGLIKSFVESLATEHTDLRLSPARYMVLDDGIWVKVVEAMPAECEYDFGPDRRNFVATEFVPSTIVALCLLNPSFPLKLLLFLAAACFTLSLRFLLY